MRLLQIAQRYARSAFELAEERGSSESLFQELAAIHEAMTNRLELMDLLKSPLISRAEKRSLVEGILGSGANPLAEQFLNLLVEKNRIDLFPFIVGELLKLSNSSKGIEEAAVVTAHELHPSITQLIQKALERLTRKQIVIQTKTDPNLLGGAQVRLGNHLIDGTLRTKLNLLDSKLRMMKT